MDITPIFITWIVFYATYKVFELFVGKRERILMIEKLSDLNLSLSGKELPDIGKLFHKSSPFSALKVGLLLMGMGIGLLTTYFLNLVNYDVLSGDYGLRNLVYTAPLLIGGGLGLLIAFIIETKMGDKKGK